MPYVMTPRHSGEIIAVMRDDPAVQFPVPRGDPPALLVTEAGDHLALLRHAGDGVGRWLYVSVEPVDVELPPQWVMQNRAPNAEELADMDPAERAEWEHRTQDTPALEAQPLPSEY